MDKEKKPRINQQIKGLNKIRLVGENQTGEIMYFSKAVSIAKETGLDLVEINPNGEFPVIKLMNYEKYIYEKKKIDKKNKSQSKDLKEIRLSVNIASNDLNVKLNQAKTFLKNGHKVKVVLIMRGREMVRKEDNKKILLNFIVQLEDISKPESMPREEKNKYTVILNTKK